MLGKTNTTTALKPSNIKNQDKLIIENGIYQADIGYTGLGTVTVNVKNASGDIITAVNKTGVVINEGDKVWLSKDVQVATSGYRIGDEFTNISNQAILSRTGKFAVCGTVGYSVTADSATKATDFDYNSITVVYIDDNSVFTYDSLNSYRVDEKTQYSLSYKLPIAQDIFNYPIRNGRAFYKIDLSNGSVLKTWSASTSSDEWHYDRQAMVNGKIYQLCSDFYSNYIIKFTLNDDLTATHTRYAFDNAEDVNPRGTTSDNKYIVCKNSNNYLRLVEVINEDHLRCLLQSEMPEDLQEFYSARTCSIVFNPYTGVLTVKSDNVYVIMKYENGVWTKLPIDLNTEDKNLLGVITLSDDLTRACFGFIGNNPSYQTGQIRNISNTSGYTALPPAFYNMSRDLFTGKATTSADTDKSFDVSIVLPDKVAVTVTCETDDVELNME